VDWCWVGGFLGWCIYGIMMWERGDLFFIKGKDTHTHMGGVLEGI